MKAAIMQPYLFPYIGYFQLIAAVDKFVVYDNIKFTKKGWINRNRILVNGKDEYISIPLKKDSDFLNVDQRFLADSFSDEKEKLLRKIAASYRKAPFFSDTYSLVEEILNFQDRNLFRFILNSVSRVCSVLSINTPLVVSSHLPINHSLKSQEKVLEICSTLGALTYINPMGGLDLYDKSTFAGKGIRLQFLKSGNIQYKQYGGEFVPWLSIIDVMMFNSKEEIAKMLSYFTLE